MKKIIMFVMVLAILAPALADDLNQPNWALAPGTIYGIWNFEVESPSGDTAFDEAYRDDYPEEGAMVPHDTNPEPDEFTETSDTGGAHKYMIQNEAFEWSWLASYQGREGVIFTELGLGVYMNNFEGDGTKLIRLQITWWPSEEAEFVDWYVGWNNDTEEIGPLDPPDLLVAEIEDLGDGWRHSTYELEIPENPSDEGIWIGTWGNNTAIDQLVIDTICYSGDEPPIGPGRGEVNPILIDPNVMIVYETDETEGDFDVRMRNPMEPETSVTVTVDPNSDDITLIGSAPDGTITMIFDANDWDVPQTVVFKAIDDEIPEPPELLELQRIVISSVYSEPLQDPNWAGQEIVTVKVVDNDQANIMFRVTPFRGGPKAAVIGPVQLSEQYTGGDLLKWRKIGIQLQVQPEKTEDPGNPTSVKLYAVVEEVEGQPGGDNLPLTDPCLPLPLTDDPNCFTYTSTTSSNGLPGGCPDHDVANKTTCWNVDQNIQIWGNDDDVLQAEGAEQEGDQNYQAGLVVTVIDGGGDERYEWTVIEDPCEPDVETLVGLERTVQFNIEDNECGAFGIVPMDVSNRFYMTDPNYGAGDPDCRVDVYDVIEFAKQWMDCSDPKDEDCTSYLD